MSELIGKTVRGYNLIEKIGQGGFAQVFKARQDGDDIIVETKEGATQRLCMLRNQRELKETPNRCLSDSLRAAMSCDTP